MANIFSSIFGGSSEPQQQQQQAQAQPSPAQPGNIDPNIDPNASPAQPNPANPAPANPEPDAPLADFKDLWETKPNDSGNEPTPTNTLTAEAVQKAVAKADFSSAITPETMAAINSGGEDAAKAFANAMNQVAQQVMVQATLVSNKMTEQAVADALSRQQAELPNMLRDQVTTNHLNETNPLFSNPAVKPVIEATKAQLLQKYPNASAAQITEMTQNYITQMGKAFAPQDTVNSNSGLEPDWEAFFKN